MAYLDIKYKTGKYISRGDPLDLPKSMILGALKLDCQNDSNRRNRMLRFRKSPAWESQARELLEKVGMEEKTLYSIEDLQNLSVEFPGVNFHVFTRVKNQRYYVKSHETSEQGSVIHLMQFDGNFDIISPSRALLGCTFCRDCGGYYSVKYQHRCTRKCGSCRFPKSRCSDQERRQELLCGDCNKSFYSVKCFDNHLQRHQRSQPACAMFKKCPDCNVNYVTKREHVCDRKRCPNCHGYRYANSRHDCNWIPPTPETVEKLLEKQKKLKVVFFDVETVQLRSPDDWTEYLPEHWVNMLCWSRACAACLDLLPHELCPGECGPVRRGCFRHDTGQSQDVVVQSFVHMLLMDRSFDNSICVSHNGSRFDNHMIVGEILRRKIVPDIIKRGLQLIQMKIRKSRDHDVNNIQFKDSCLFLSTSLKNLPRSFGYEDLMRKGDFPYLFNHPDNYGLISPQLPIRQYYGDGSKSLEERRKFGEWYRENRHSEFNFNVELESYCSNDVDVLHVGVCRYMKRSIEETGFNPIYHCLTYASFSFFLIKNIYLEPDQVGILPENGYHSAEIQSKMAIKTIKWLEQKTGRLYKYKLRGGEHVIETNGRRIRVDGFIAPSTVLEVNGCFWHGCPTCTKADQPHPYYHNKTMREIYQETEERRKILLDLGYSVQEIWEHDITREMQTNKEMKEFFKNTRLCTSRLILQDSFAGGRTQNFRTSKVPGPRERLFWLDYCSMYPDILKKTFFPIGTPEVITDNFLPIDLPLAYHGFLKLDLLPPKNLLHPVIWMRSGGKLIFPLCAKCGEQREQKLCTHTDDERIIHCTVYHGELVRALECGYTVKHVYEVWHWPTEKWQCTLFPPFLKLFIKAKLEASGFPNPDWSLERKQQWVDEVEEKEGVRLDWDMIESNPGRRMVAKLNLNSIWGKYCERPVRSETKFFNFGDWPTEFTDPRYTVTDLTEVTADIMMMTYRLNEEFAQPIPYTNLAIASITTAVGRLMIHSLLMRLQDRALYIDTDSICGIERPFHDNLEDDIGEFIGDLTSEVPSGYRIKEFLSTGPKVYGIQMTKEDGSETITKLRIRGFTIDQDNKAALSFESLRTLVGELLSFQGDGVTTRRPMLVKNFGRISTVMRKKVLRPVMDKLMFNSEGHTRPYGYSNDADPFVPAASLVAEMSSASETEEEEPVNVLEE